MNKVYEPNSIEKKWYKYWEDNGFFKPANPGSPAYTIVIPPPNVTGILHMGHVLNNTLQDILIRYKRVKGFHTLWLPGTDHAGIATQNKVEQALRNQNLTKEDLGREAFVQRVWEWKEKHGGIIIEQLKQLGCSCDWDREHFTMDEDLSHAVRVVFVKLFEKKLIYQGHYIVNWCPRCKTAISDEEVLYSDRQSYLWYIRYPAEDGGDGVVVATTRPETMLGDTAVAVHPEDPRFQHLIGRNVILPLLRRPIPVVVDDMVDREFGTGAVKITPAHDPNDFEAGKRHGLKQLIVIGETGLMTDLAGDRYAGLDRDVCRKKVVADLEAEGLLVKTEKYEHSVGQCYRCDTVIEPYLSKQWFVRMAPLARPALEVVKENRLVFYPDRWTKVYINWMENIRDWCISRQLWWGHRIPVWTCEECGYINAFVDDPKTCPACGSKSFMQDPDVLDTWFSSWLWPFSTMGWPGETNDLKTFFPTDSLITAPEIIFFWVARMIMASLEFTGEIPFNKVYLHGTVRDEIGRKMSKSLGNSPDPLDIISQYGADALRFGMVMIAPRGSDIFFTEDSLNVGRTFANKCWNAAKLILSNCGESPSVPGKISIDSGTLTLADKWILYRLARADADIQEHLECFRFNDAAVTIHRFIWHEFCDWYLEIAKLALYSHTSANHQETVKQILLKCLGHSLQLLHPFMPYLTEEIWHRLFPSGGSIMHSNLENISGYLDCESESKPWEMIQNAVISLRTIRSETHIPPSEKVNAVLCVKSDDQIQALTRSQDAVIFLARLASLEIASDPKLPQIRATSVTPEGLDVYIDLQGIVDVPMEIKRLEKELAKTDSEIDKVAKKLSNPNFVDKAPDNVVEKTRRIHEELTTKRSKLEHARSLFQRD